MAKDSGVKRRRRTPLQADGACEARRMKTEPG